MNVLAIYTTEKLHSVLLFPDIKRPNTSPMQLVMRLPLARLVLLLLATSAFLELLRLLVCFLNCLTDLPLLLACLDCDGEIACLALFRCFLDGLFGFLPVCCAGADFVPGRMY